MLDAGLEPVTSVVGGRRLEYYTLTFKGSLQRYPMRRTAEEILHYAIYTLAALLTRGYSYSLTLLQQFTSPCNHIN